jgi:hypothetical protein
MEIGGLKSAPMEGEGEKSQKTEAPREGAECI